MSSNVDTIKERLNIVDIISSYIKVEKASGNFKARCPFHNEKTPSFFISPDRGTYYCFGCGAKGDIFSFVQQFEGVDFRGALKMLAEKAGVELGYESRESGDEKGKLFALMEAATKVYEGELVKNKGALEYLSKRGLTEKTIKEWRIGYAPNEWHFTEMSLKKNASITEMERAGLVKRGDKGMYDRFRGRIMFPLFDVSGRVVAFSGRAFDNPEDEAKYLNSPETPIFNKSSVLYGLHKAKAVIREKDYVVLVEGQVDLLMSHQAGFGNTVATSGTSLTEGHLALIKRFSNRMMVAYDADGAGWRASKRAWEMALALGMEIKIAEIPEGFDPADLILSDKQKFVDALKNSKHIIDLALEKIVATEKDHRIFGKRVKEEVLPYIASIESNIEQSHYVKKISEVGNISEEALWKDLAVVSNSKEEQKVEEAVAKDVSPQRASIEHKILGILYWQEKQPSPKIDIRTIRGELERILSRVKLEKIEVEVKENKDDLVFEAEVYYADSDILEKAIKELLKNLELEELQITLTSVMKQCSIAEKAGEESKAQMLLIEVQGILNKINVLKTRK